MLLYSIASCTSNRYERGPAFVYPTFATDSLKMLGKLDAEAPACLTKEDDIPSLLGDWTGSHFESPEKAPNPKDIPLPRFKGPPSDAADGLDCGGSEESKAERTRMKVEQMVGRQCPALQKLLGEAATCLLEQKDKSATLAYLGRQLSAGSKRKLRNRQMRLAHVLRCFENDFDFTEDKLTVLYKSTEVKEEYELGEVNKDEGKPVDSWTEETL